MNTLNYYIYKHFNPTRMKTKLLPLLLIAMFCLNTFAQNKDYHWLLGFGTHGPQMTINDAPFFKEYFRVNNWNLLPGIGKVWIDRAIGNSLTIGTQLSLGAADRKPKLTNEHKFFLDWDINLKYKFANGYILNTKCWFDPYFIGSLGLTHFDRQNSATFGLGAGTNIWITKKFGFNIETSYNKLVGKNHTPSYMHHAIGVVIRFGKGSDKDKDGVADFEDECIDVFGLVELGGCPDSDGDGLKDMIDKCPSVAGLIAFQGCPDTDEDGIVDSDDDCPREAGTKEMHGCPDSDADGIVDKDDACPDMKGSVAMRGCPDRDGDGVDDKNDNCPDVVGDIATQGCPSMKKETIQQRLSFAAKSIQFESGKDIINISSYPVLNEIVAIMNESTKLRIAIEGHTDNSGVAQKNMDLSARRAGAVMNYIAVRGITPSRLTSVGYGDTKPLEPNTTLEGRKANRRVDIKVIEE